MLLSYQFLLQVNNDSGRYNSPNLSLVAWRPSKTVSLFPSALANDLTDVCTHQTTGGSLSAPDWDTSTPDLEPFFRESVDEDIEEILSPQALNESLVQPHLDKLLVGLPDSGWGRLEFLKTNVELLLVLETTWACPLLSQAIIEARVAVREADAGALYGR